MRSNFQWTLVGSVVFAAAQWAMLLAIARLGTPEMVGMFALGLAITAPIVILTNLKLRSVLVTDAKSEYEFGHYIALRLVSIAVAFAAIALAALVLAHSIEATVVILLVGLAKVFDSASDILYGYMQRQERMARIAISRMIQGMAQFVSLSAVLAVTGNLITAVLAWAVASGAVTVLYDFPSTRRAIELDRQTASEGHLPTRAALAAPVWALNDLRSLAWLSLPLGMAAALGSLWTNIPRYVISALDGASALGIFAAIAALTVVGSTIVGALGLVVSPRLAKYNSSGRYGDFDHLVVRLLLFGAALGLVGLMIAVVAGEPILDVLYGPEYAQYVQILVILMIAMTMQITYVFLGTGIQAMRNFKVHMPIQAASAVVVLVLSWGLVSSMGIVGAAWAMVGANLFEFVAYAGAFWLVRRRVRTAPYYTKGKH